MSFELVQDKDGRKIRPRKGLLFYYRRANFDGMKQVGEHRLYARGPDHLPTVYGVVLAIRHDSPVCVLNLARDEGGLMPGDLIHFDRYTAEDFDDVRLVLGADVYNEETRRWEVREVPSIEPLLAMDEQAVLCRVDGVLPDPWETALAELPARPEPVLVSG
jgi:hypothetical protein